MTSDSVDAGCERVAAAVGRCAFVDIQATGGSNLIASRAGPTAHHSIPVDARGRCVTTAVVHATAGGLGAVVFAGATDAVGYAGITFLDARLNDAIAAASSAARRQAIIGVVCVAVVAFLASVHHAVTAGLGLRSNDVTSTGSEKLDCEQDYP